MPSIVIQCSKCKRHLKIESIAFNPLDEVEFAILPCDNIGCYDCSKCKATKKLEEEDMETKKCYGEWEPNFQECQECKLRIHCIKVRELSETNN